MKRPFFIFTALLLMPLAAPHAADAPKKSLPLPGEVFLVQGREAFVIPPQASPANGPVPWVWYAPTLPGLPGDEERWMFERFARGGSAIAGIDVGESFGSPDGRALYSAFYDELTRNRGFAPKPVMLGRSRGGLMTLSWAADNPDKVAGFAGIYPVCSLISYPGVDKACGAYRLTKEDLSAHLADYNPIDRLAALAEAVVPLFAIHGDSDTVVPLEANSGEMRKRYEALGGTMQLIVPPGQGHNMWTGFFQCQELVDFVLARQKRTTPAELQPLNAGHSMDYTAVFDAPPKNVPTKAMPDGPLLGNGDVGVAMAGPPEAQRFHIGKNDFWTRHPGDARVITVGTVSLSIPALQGASYRQEQDLAKAEVRGVFAKDGLTVRTRSWVDANANLLLTQLQCEGGPVTFSVRLASGISGGEASPENWFTRKADDLPGKGREVAVATRIIGAQGLEATLRPGETATVATAIVSDLDAQDLLAAAKSSVADLTPETVETRTVQHREWWQGYWRRSFIEIPDKVVEKHWYAALYALGSCSRAGKVAPGLWGNWLTTDTPNWHGDFHLNYNFQAPYYLAYGSNHADLSLPFYQAVLESMDNGRAMAQRHGWKGVHFPVCIGPWGLSPENPDGDWGQRSDAAYAALNFIWYWQFTQDTDFLRQTAYPYLREVAAFWEDYLKFEDGRYVIYNDSIHEGSGPDFNPILSLGLVRALFTNMIPMSEALGVDAGNRATWQDILDKLSAFPTQERDGKMVFRYSEKGMDWCDGNTLGIQHIFPSGAIGLDSDPRLLGLSRNMIDAMHRWTDNNGFSSWYTACARVGYDPQRILKGLRHECDKQSAPNLLLQYGGGGIENCSGFLAVNEMLLQSHDGVIRLFPCWPMDLDARFGTLRAVGAFLVSAEIKGGIISGVTLRSEKGRDCAVVNPWPDRNVQVIRNGMVGETLSGDRFTVKTAVDETLELCALK
jgi:pimeloyl-ACP methyl ester carboxylesterase